MARKKRYLIAYVTDGKHLNTMIQADSLLDALSMFIEKCIIKGIYDISMLGIRKSCLRKKA